MHNNTASVLITDGVHSELIESFESIGFNVNYQPDISYEETLAIISQYEGLIVNSKILVNRTFIDRATQLKFVGRLGSGMEIIDKTYAESKGIAIFNSPEGNRTAVAEHVFSMVLCLMNNICKANSEIRNFQWKREENRGNEISAKTFGIIGAGNTGESVIRRLQGWDCDIIVYDPYRNLDPNAYPNVVQVDSLKKLLNSSDIVSLHIPLNDETHYLVDKEFLQEMKSNAILINTSRGGVVKTSELILSLQENKIGGACLDVFENENQKNFLSKEKLFYKKLYNFENVILTPHVAGWTRESKEKLSKILFEKIKSFLNQK